MKIAIIAIYHQEASLCLAKNIANNKCEVDFYYITDIIKDKNKVSGFEYLNASRKPGIIKLSAEVIPELTDDTKGLSIKYHLLRLLPFSEKFHWINKLIIKYSFRKIKDSHYDVINIIGHSPLARDIHNSLKEENIIHTMHEVGNHWDNQSELSPLLKTLINAKTKVILPSISTFNRYVSLIGFTEGCAKMIPIGKLETYKLYEKDLNFNLGIKSNNIFLFWGFIKPYKGLALLAKSVGILLKSKRDFHLIIAGNGTDPNLSYFEKLPNATVINRFLNNDEVISLNKLCSCVVCPYISASQSGIILTSFLYGKPIIATKVGALVDTIIDGVNGLLVKPDSPEDFAKAMEMIITDDILLNNLSKGAFDFGHGDEYDWDIIAKKTIAFFCKK